MNEKEFVVRTPLFPLYSEVKQLLAVWNGVPKALISEMLQAIWAHSGTPKNPTDWSSPSDWIAKLLTGDVRQLAQRVWEKSGKTVNPRHTYGTYLFVNTYQLLIPDEAGVYRISDLGTLFLKDEPETIRKIDVAEGLPKLLAILAAHSPARRRDILEEWGEFLLANSKFGTASTIKDTLRRRMQNLVERGFVDRDGNTYTITETGISYAANTDRPAALQPRQQVLGAIKKYNEEQKAELRERLSVMDPYKFETLVKDLLDAMGYEDVEVTKQSGDKGVDVVATHQFGITQIKEVVQVKRHQGSITRPVLDQLRGALPYHQAIRGTIITLGRFAKGCKDAALFQGAAPISLIDGDMLMELLLTNDVGVIKRLHAIFEIDEGYFSGQEQDPEGNIKAEK